MIQGQRPFFGEVSSNITERIKLLNYRNPYQYGIVSCYRSFSYAILHNSQTHACRLIERGFWNPCHLSQGVLQMSNDIKELHPLILQLANADQRESALLELSKKREAFPDLAPVLWHSFGTIAALLQEIISIYPMLSPPTLSPHASNRVCNALALLQCVASHPETKSKLMNGN